MGLGTGEVWVLLLNSFEANEEGSSGKEKKRCNPRNTRVLDINKHAGRISKGRLLAGKPLMCRWEIREANAVQRGMNTYCLPTHTNTASSPHYQAKIWFVCLPAISPVTSTKECIFIDAKPGMQSCNGGISPGFTDKLDEACLVLHLENIC